jgi:signal transduction histidine kinase
MQENFTNIIKHAEARKVWVNIKIKEDGVTLVMIDDGKGFHTKRKSSGIGITNMKTRAESLNGTFHLISSPGKGTVLSVQIPYTHT